MLVFVRTFYFRPRLPLMAGGLLYLLILGGCVSREEALAPVSLSLGPGAVSPDNSRLAVAAADQYLLFLREGQWEPINLPRSFMQPLLGRTAFAAFSANGNLMAYPFLNRSHQQRNIYIHNVASGAFVVWLGYACYHPWQTMPLAMRFDGEVLHCISALYRRGQPDGLFRLTYDLTDLSEEEVQAGLECVTRMATLTLSEPINSPQDFVGGAFLNLEAPRCALVINGEIVRWDLTKPAELDPYLTRETVARQAGLAEAIEPARVTLLLTPGDGPVYAAYWLSPETDSQQPPGEQKVLVWRLPATGEPEYVGDAAAPGEGTVLELAPRPGGEGWAQIRTAAGAPGPTGTTLTALYLCGPRFDDLQAVALPDPSPRDLAWHPQGSRLYFVLKGTEIWVKEAGQEPTLLAPGPPVVAFEPAN